jgi:hypothetical protein
MWAEYIEDTSHQSVIGPMTLNITTLIRIEPNDMIIVLLSVILARVVLLNVIRALTISTKIVSHV